MHPPPIGLVIGTRSEAEQQARQRDRKEEGQPHVQGQYVCHADI